MFLTSKPEGHAIEEFIASSRNSDYSYPEIGFTKVENNFLSDRVPNGYTGDHNRIILGVGGPAFDKAKAAIRSWKMFGFDWVDLCWPDTPIEEDRTVAILIKHFGFYSLNAARIVYVIDKPHRFGFAYGTLTEHGESGEERFIVEIDAATGEVWYDIFAFSRAHHFLARLGYPLTRYLQQRFAKDSKAAMLRAIQPC